MTEEALYLDSQLLAGSPRLLVSLAITDTVGALSFALFAKGGSRECLYKWFDHVTRS
jgi:hypothetical protein